jgi:transcriptional regulator with XRE-family HTH domain
MREIPTSSRYRNDAFLKKLGIRIKRVRISKGYSMDALANESNGVNRSSLSRTERGLTDPQISTLKRIADTIGVEITDFFK